MSEWRPSTKAGERLVWLLTTTKEPNGRHWPRAFDARLVERIAQEFVPRIEEEARETGRAALELAALEGRNVVPDLTDDQAHLIEAWAARALGETAKEGVS